MFWMKIIGVLNKKHPRFGEKTWVIFSEKSSGAFSKIMPSFFENHAEEKINSSA